jgi:uncharacterized BrkB/YihY/UPF0761 family membrane protein
MNILSYYLGKAEGMTIFPIIGILIFFAFFVFLSYFILRLGKGFIKEMENLPLGNDAEPIEDIIINKEIHHGEK